MLIEGNAPVKSIKHVGTKIPFSYLNPSFVNIGRWKVTRDLPRWIFIR